MVKVEITRPVVVWVDAGVFASMRCSMMFRARGINPEVTVARQRMMLVPHGYTVTKTRPIPTRGEAKRRKK